MRKNIPCVKWQGNLEFKAMMVPLWTFGSKNELLNILMITWMGLIAAALSQLSMKRANVPCFEIKRWSIPMCSCQCIIFSSMLLWQRIWMGSLVLLLLVVVKERVSTFGTLWLCVRWNHCHTRKMCGVFALTPLGTKLSLEPNQVGFVERALILKCDWFIDELVVGHVGIWDLANGDLIEHKVHDGGVYRLALSGDRIVTCDDQYDVIRLFNLCSCLVLFRFRYYFIQVPTQLRWSSRYRRWFTAILFLFMAMLFTLGAKSVSFSGTWSPIQLWRWTDILVWFWCTFAHFRLTLL